MLNQAVLRLSMSLFVYAFSGDCLATRLQDQLREQVEARVENFTTIDLTWAASSHFTKAHAKRLGSAPFGDGKRANATEFPMAFQWSGRLQIDGNKFRVEHNRPGWRFEQSRFEQDVTVSVFDGEIGKRLMTFPDYSFPNQGLTRNRPIDAITNIDFSSLLWHFRAFRYNDMLGDRFFKDGATVEAVALEERKTALMKVKLSGDDQDIEYSFLIDPSDDFSTKNFTLAIDGQIIYDVQMSFAHREHLVFPNTWRMTEFNKNGDLLISTDCKLVEIKINEPADPTAFELQYPVGTVVIDQTNQNERQLLIGEKETAFQFSNTQAAAARDPQQLLDELSSPSFFQQNTPLLLIICTINAFILLLIFRRFSARDRSV